MYCLNFAVLEMDFVVYKFMLIYRAVSNFHMLIFFASFSDMPSWVLSSMKLNLFLILEFDCISQRLTLSSRERLWCVKTSLYYQGNKTIYDADA